VDRYRWRLWAPLSGVAAAALFIISFVVAGEPGDTSREIGQFFADDSNRSRVQVAWVLFSAGILLLVWFVWTLRNRLVTAEGGLTGWATLAFTAGMVSVPLWFMANSLFTAPAFDWDRTDFDAAATQLLATVGYLSFVGAQMVFAVALFATALVVFRTRVFPMWFGWATLIIGLTLLFAVSFFPFFFFLAWLIAAGVLMMWQAWVELGGRRPTRTSAGA
jgi:Domain of unknown function (DUF4386)